MTLALLTLLTAWRYLRGGILQYHRSYCDFQCAVIPIAVMGVVLETGKLVTASWLYQNWKRVPKLLKTYLISAVVVADVYYLYGYFRIFIETIHIEQTTVNSDNTLQIELMNSKIQRERDAIKRAENTLLQLDSALEKYVELGAVTKGLNARKEQEAERNELNATIDESTTTIAELTQKKSELNADRIAIEAEVGPIKYIAELIYGEGSSGVLEDAVGVILVIVFVFDPLAVLLLVAANMSLKEEQTKRRRRRTIRKSKEKKRKETAWEKKGQGNQGTGH